MIFFLSGELVYPDPRVVFEFKFLNRHLWVIPIVVPICRSDDLSKPVRHFVLFFIRIETISVCSLSWRTSVATIIVIIPHWAITTLASIRTSIVLTSVISIRTIVGLSSLKCLYFLTNVLH